MLNQKRIADGITVSAQPSRADFDDLAGQGVVLVINNRLDGEAPGQPTAAESARWAEQAGLSYRHIPVTLPTLAEEQVDRFGEAVASAGGPVHAHCAVGQRSALLWMLSQVRRGAMTRGQAADWAQAHGLNMSAGFAWLDQHPG